MGSLGSVRGALSNGRPYRDLWRVLDSQEEHPMWQPEHRRAAQRKGLRYPSDMTDQEWALAAPLIGAAKRGGRKRTVNVREVLNAIFYVLWTGCQWKALW